jgi:hypothetical protein
MSPRIVPRMEAQSATADAVYICTYRLILVPPPPRSESRPRGLHIIDM